MRNIFTRREIEASVRREFNADRLQEFPASNSASLIEQQQKAMEILRSGKIPEKAEADIVGRMYQDGLNPEQWSSADKDARLQALTHAKSLMLREMNLSGQDNAVNSELAKLDDAADAYSKLWQEMKPISSLPDGAKVSERGASIIAEAEKEYRESLGREFERRYREFRPERLYQEIQTAEWRRIEDKQSLKEILSKCNPNYKKALCWNINCQRCVPAYEMRARGYDVTAKPKMDMTDRLSRYPFEVWDNADIHNTKGNGMKEIEDFVNASGEGTRVQVIAQWKYGGGHTFAAEMRDGQIRFVDPQTGDDNVKSYFARVKPDTVKFCRIDNLRANSGILDCCEEVRA